MNKALSKLLLINEQTYRNVEFNAGAAFAEFYYGGDKVVALVLQTPAYWAWWGNYFEATNAAFVSLYANTRINERELLHLWEQAHTPEAVIAFPSQYVVEQAMHLVFKQATSMQQHLVSVKKRSV